MSTDGSGRARTDRIPVPLIGAAALPILLALAATVGISAASAPEPALQLVESAPIETSLDHPDIADAYQVWPEMIGSAGRTLDFAEFYASGDPGSRLETVVRAVEEAAGRGIHVRYLAEEKFYKTYPEILDRLAATKNIEVRRYNVASLMGGVLHAKYFIVDGREGYLGSQNFDWRSLTHIQELGVRIREARTVRALSDIFEMDWALAGGGRPAPPERPAGGQDLFPVRLVADRDTTEVILVASPRSWLPDSSLWDLPRIVKMIDGAKKSARVQLLTYKTTERDGTYFAELESALRRAAARGVGVQLLLSDWCKRAGTIEGLKSLEPLPNVEVKLVTIPAWSGGFIPFARVIHAKYLVVDGREAWIGTSNWEKGYFYDSRNVGIIVRGGGIPPSLDRFFLDGWNGPYAEEVDPCRAYPVPRIGE
jgi:phosphatidylserine/phosphatidylglycerophosphate/cardiolipin synthase-like enzyme